MSNEKVSGRICPLMSQLNTTRLVNVAGSQGGAGLAGVPCVGFGCSLFVPMFVEGQKPNEVPKAGACAPVAISMALSAISQQLASADEDEVEEDETEQ